MVVACTGVMVGKLYGGVDRNERMEGDSGGWTTENALTSLALAVAPSCWPALLELLLDRFRWGFLFGGCAPALLNLDGVVALPPCGSSLSLIFFCIFNETRANDGSDAALFLFPMSDFNEIGQSSECKR